MKPPSDLYIVGSGKQISNDPRYEFVAGHSFDVYPGWATRYVWRHKESGTLWARDYFMSDDVGHEGPDWFAVKEVVVTRYEKIQ